MNFFITVFLSPINLLCHKLRYKSSSFNKDFFVFDESLLVDTPHLITFEIDKKIILIRVVLDKLELFYVLAVPKLAGHVTSYISVNVLAFVLTHLGLPCWLNVKLHILQSDNVGVLDDLASVPNREAFLVEVVVDLYSHNF